MADLTQQTQTASLARGRLLVNGVAITLIATNVLSTFQRLHTGGFGDYYLLAALRLGWVFVVGYCLSEGQRWARWLAVVSLAVVSIFGILSLASPPASATPRGEAALVAALLLQALCLYILCVSDSAAAFFKANAEPS